jgi:exodeoxyribonuclease V gamma subunit
MCILLSNHIEELVKHLNIKLCSPSPLPFSSLPLPRHIVLVPHRAVQSWLTLNITNNLPSHMEILCLEEGLLQLMDIFPQAKESSHLPLASAIEIHLFGINHLNSIENAFFEHLGKEASLSFYCFSPCQHFWSDVLSNKEASWLQRHLTAKGANPQQLNALRTYLEDTNSLLANWGTLGRKLTKKLEASHLPIVERYVAPLAIQQHSSYQDFLMPDLLLSDAYKPLTILEAIQTDILFLRRPSHKQKFHFSEYDYSLQIHMASSKRREVEILYDRLLHLIQKKESTLNLKEIIVLTPALEEYLPFIKTIFESEDSQLPVAIMQEKPLFSHPCVQAFWHLISISQSRWDANTIMHLFTYSAFLKKHQLSEEEVYTLNNWVADRGVRWGYDVHHRNELLKQGHCQHQMVDSSEVGTWQFALNKIFCEEEKNNELLSTSEEKLLKKFAGILAALKKDLQILNDGSLRKLSDWTDLLSHLLNTYFYSEEKEKEIFQLLREAFTKLIELDCEIDQPFITVQHHLTSLLKESDISLNIPNLHSIRFYSLFSPLAIPAKVVALLGMEEERFPQVMQAKTPPTDVLQPSQEEIDRFLFLEILLTARESLIITYCGYSAEDDKEQLPSPLVTELISYLDMAYCIKEDKVSSFCFYRHPFHSYDESYFFGKSPFPSYSEYASKMAKAVYQTEKHTVKNFISHFTPTQKDSQKKLTSHLKNSTRIKAHDLVAFARNPLKSYFNKTLGIYLEDFETKNIKDHENFHLNALQHYLLKKDFLKWPVEQIFQNAEREGFLPIGPFKNLVLNKVKEEAEELKLGLLSLGISMDEIFTLSFHSENEIALKKEERIWRVPPLTIENHGRQVTVEGDLFPLSSEGIIVTIKQEKIDLFKVWPQCLLTLCLAKKYHLPIKNQLLMVKGSSAKIKEFVVDNPFLFLNEYVDFYFSSLQEASPLIPEWIYAIVSEEPEQLSQKLQASLNNSFHPLRNPYMQWALQQHHHLDIATWKQKIEKLFSPILDQL